MKKINLVGSAAVGLMVASGSAHAAGDQIIEIDLNGWQTWGRLGSTNNTSIVIDLSATYGNDFQITGVGWDLTIASIGSSWNSEVVFDIDGGVFVTPGTGTTGTASYSSGGIIKLVDANIADIQISDGDFRIEVFESFDDPNNTDTGQVQDANLSDSFFIQLPIPAPGAFGLLGIAGLIGVGGVGGRRRNI